MALSFALNLKLERLNQPFQLLVSRLLLINRQLPLAIKQISFTILQQ